MSEPILSLWRGEIHLRKTITGRQIAREVAARHGLTLEDFESPTRRRAIAWPRQEAMWAIRQNTHLSYPQIARIFRKKDHTTIIHGERAHAKRIGAAS